MDDHTLVCLPLIAEGERIGGVSLSYPAVRTLPEPEVQFLMAIASQAAQAIQRSLLFEERDRTAHVLQEALLPGELPKMPDVRLAAGYWPAGRRAEVGGDFYDVIENEDGFIAVIGDVCGRGPEAAAVMGLVRTSVRVLAARESSLPDLFGAVNRALLREVGDDVSTFVTLCGVTVVRPTNGPDAPLELEILCAGHPHPVLFGSDRPRGIGVSNLALGVVEDPPMVSVRARLADGEGLILYTDGLSERARDHVALEEDPELQGAIRAAYREGPEIFIQAVEEILGETHAKQDDAAVLILQALGA
jgi:serine phosphatase RsbU (regulator of sigma subunit)